MFRGGGNARHRRAYEYATSCTDQRRLLVLLEEVKNGDQP
jgi:hypothetical protein